MSKSTKIAILLAVIGIGAVLWYASRRRRDALVASTETVPSSGSAPSETSDESRALRAAGGITSGIFDALAEATA